MDDLNEILQQLRAQGHRMTPQRRLVLEALCHSDHHLRADEIADVIEAQHPGLAIDPTTIYRTLRWLRDNDLVSETDLGQNHMVYALNSTHRHHHLVCENCHTVIEADPQMLEPVREEIARRYGFAARLTHISIFGLCEQCREEE